MHKRQAILLVSQKDDEDLLPEKLARHASRRRAPEACERLQAISERVKILREDRSDVALIERAQELASIQKEQQQLEEALPYEVVVVRTIDELREKLDQKDASRYVSVAISYAMATDGVGGSTSSSGLNNRLNWMKEINPPLNGPRRIIGFSSQDLFLKQMEVMGCDVTCSTAHLATRLQDCL